MYKPTSLLNWFVQQFSHILCINFIHKRRNIHFNIYSEGQQSKTERSTFLKKIKILDSFYHLVRLLLQKEFFKVLENKNFICFSIERFFYIKTIFFYFLSLKRKKSFQITQINPILIHDTTQHINWRTKP